MTFIHHIDINPPLHIPTHTMAPTDPTAQLSTVTYSELTDIEADFDDFNIDLSK